MPNYRDQSTDLQAIQGIGGHLNNMAYQIPMLRARQAQLQQQLMVQKALEILHQQQAREMQAHAQLYGAQQGREEAQTKNVNQKTEQAQASQTNAQTAGQAGMLSGVVGNPQMDNQAGLGQAVNLGREQGVLPQGQFDIPRSGLADAMRMIGLRAVLQSAASAPGASANVLGYHNIPQGGTGINGLGQTAMGQPKPMVLGANQTGFVPGQQPQMGIATANRGENLFDMTQGVPEGGSQVQPFAMGQPFPPQRPTSQSSALANTALKIASNTSDYKRMNPAESNIVHNIVMSQNPTNMPTIRVPTHTATNPQTGQKIQSFDGGVSWEPVTQ